MELGEPDASGRRRPVPVPGSEFVLDVDMVIPAIGQVPDLGFMGRLTGTAGHPGRHPGRRSGHPGHRSAGRLCRGRRRQRAGHGHRGHRRRQAGSREHPPLPAGRGAGRPGPRPARRAVWTRWTCAGRTSRRGRPCPSWRSRPAPPVSPRWSWALPEEQAVAEALRCLNCGVCSECRQCEIACQPHAIVHDMRDEVVELDVGAIVVATGFDPFDATPQARVRLRPLSQRHQRARVRAAGLCLGADGRARSRSTARCPKEIVFVHCVGSRDKQAGGEYCSRICCMYTAKQAHLAHDKVPGAQHHRLLHGRARLWQGL